MTESVSEADALPSPDVAQLRDTYGVDATWEAELREAWALIGAQIPDIARDLLQRRADDQHGAVTEEMVAARVGYAEAKLARPVDQAWVDTIIREADRIAQSAFEFPLVAASMVVAQMRIHALFFDLTNDIAQLERVTRATQKLAVIEFELIATRLRALARARNLAALRNEAAAARADVQDAITSTARHSRDVAHFTEQTATELSGLRVPAAEVSAAAAQSAMAMVESARSAGGLISAYADRR